MPYKNYKNVIFDIWNDEYMLKLDKIINYLQSKYPDKIENIGNLELIKDNMIHNFDKYKYIHNIKFNIDFKYSKLPHLDYPQIKHDITELKYINIYRIFKSDNNTKLQTSSDLVNWSGIILSEECRKYVTNGNLLRIKLNGERCYGCCYFTILHKLNNKKFLANVHNNYCSKYEDTVIIIDTDSICEIPTIWEVNDNFKEFDKKEGLGYSMTGYRENKNENLIDITYDELIFNGKLNN